MNHHKHQPSNDQDLLITEINDLNLGWRADTCKLQKTHPDYGTHCHESNLAEVKKPSETSKVEFGKQPNFSEALTEAQKYAKKYQDTASIPDSELPLNFDWRNVSGVDFTNPHRDQGACASCSFQSFVQIIEQRL